MEKLKGIKGKIIDNILNICLQNNGSSDTNFNISTGTISKIDLSLFDTEPILPKHGTSKTLYDTNLFPFIIADNSDNPIENITRCNISQADLESFLVVQLLIS